MLYPPKDIACTVLQYDQTQIHGYFHSFMILGWCLLINSWSDGSFEWDAIGTVSFIVTLSDTIFYLYSFVILVLRSYIYQTTGKNFALNELPFQVLHSGLMLIVITVTLGYQWESNYLTIYLLVRDIINANILIHRLFMWWCAAGYMIWPSSVALPY